jgi:hypothetical protein
MWPLGYVGHVTYSFINMLFISTEIFDDKLRPQICRYRDYRICRFKVHLYHLKLWDIGRLQII